MTKPEHSNSADSAWKMIESVIGFPGKVQGYLLNALLNTIDRAQTEALLRESAELQAKQQKRPSTGKHPGGCKCGKDEC